MIHQLISQQLYIAYFGRPADAGGRGNFGAELQRLVPNVQTFEDFVFQVRQAQADASNPGLIALVRIFADSRESMDLYGGDTEGFVRAVYRNVLAREGEEEGVAFWVTAIDQRGLNRSLVSLEILYAATRNGQGDSITVNRKIQAAELFTDAVGTEKGLENFRGNEAAQLARNMLNQVDSNTDTDGILELVSPVAQSFADPVVVLTLPQALALGALPNRYEITGLDNAMFNDIAAGDVAGLLQRVQAVLNLALNAPGPQFKLQFALRDTLQNLLALEPELLQMAAGYTIDNIRFTRDLGVQSVATLQTALADSAPSAAELALIEGAANSQNYELLTSYALVDTAAKLLAHSSPAQLAQLMKARSIEVSDPVSITTLLGLAEINPAVVASRVVIVPDDVFAQGALVNEQLVIGLLANASHITIEGLGLSLAQFAALRAVTGAQVQALLYGTAEQAFDLNAQGLALPAPLISDGGTGLVQKTLLAGTSLVSQLQLANQPAAGQAVLGLAGQDATFFEINTLTRQLRIKEDQVSQAQAAAAARQDKTLQVAVTSTLNGLTLAQQFQVQFSTTATDDVSSTMDNARVLGALSVFEGKIFDPNPGRFSNEDFEFFEVSFKADRLYKINLTTNSFTELTVFDKQGGGVLLAAQGVSQTFPLSTFVRFDEDQTAVLKIRGLSSGNANSYRLEISPETQDKHAADFQFATQLNNGDSVTDLISAGDRDTFKVDLLQGERYFFTIETDNASSAFYNGMFGTLYDPARQFLSIQRSDFADIGEGRVRLVYVVEPEVSGQHFFRVFGTDQTVTQDYTLGLSMSVQLDATSDFEAGASIISTNKIVSERIDHAADFDFYKLSLTQPGSYELGFIASPEQFGDSNSGVQFKIFSAQRPGDAPVFNTSFSGTFGSAISFDVELAGDYFVEVSSNGVNGSIGDYKFFVADQSTVITAELSDTFDVYFDYVQELAYLKPQFDEVAQVFSSLITKGLPDWKPSAFGDVFDFDVRVVLSDIAGTAVATGGPSGFRTPEALGGFFTGGILTFDRTDLQRLVAEDKFKEVLSHELMHALGIGTVWEQKGLLDDRGYIGQQGLAAYRMLSGDPSLEFVPLADGEGHWNEAIFGDELMTPFFNYSADAALSVLTLAGLADLGYQVDFSRAEDYLLMLS